MSETRPAETRVLIVEDSRFQAEVLQDFLREHGFLTASAGNGSEALGVMERFRPAIVISDIVMPVMDGFEFCRRVKSDERFRAIPVVLLTALSDPKDVLKSLECGADSFVVKPYEEKLLLDRLDSILENLKLRDESAAAGGIDLLFSGERFFITAGSRQILDLLLSTYEAAVQKQRELIRAHEQLREFNEQLEDRVHARTRELQNEIGERRRTEAQLRKTKQMLQSITDGFAENIVLLSKDYSIEWANRTALQHVKKLRQDDTHGHSCYELFHRRDTPCEETAQPCPLRECLATGKAVNLTHTHFDADGATKLVEVSAYPIRDETGAVIQIVHVSRDLTEQLRFQENLIRTTEELKRIDRMKSEFISVASHELRTPLTAITNAIDLMLKKRAGDLTEAQDNFLKMAARNIARLTTLINDILSISKIESGAFKLHCAETDVRALVDDVVTTVRPLADAKSIAVHCRIGEDLPQLSVDREKLERVLINLVGNAVKFTPARGRIVITARLAPAAAAGAAAPSPWIAISVSDTGVGIAPEHQTRLFEKFYQVHDSLSTDKPAGTGLGLSIAAGLVKRHGGTITCTSAVGEGSTFTVMLPVLSFEAMFFNDLEAELSLRLRSHRRVSLLSLAVCPAPAPSSVPDAQRLMTAVRDVILHAGRKSSDVIDLLVPTREAFLTLPETDAAGVQAARRRILQELPAQITGDGQIVYRLTYRTGTASFPEQAQTADKMIAAARRYEQHGERR